MANETSLRVTVVGLDKLKRDIEKRYGKAALQRRGKAALKEAADQIVVPAVQQNTPIGDASSPWHRNRSPQKHMRDTVSAHSLRPFKTEIAAVGVGFHRYYKVFVIRGSKPHDIPNWPRKGMITHHPGAYSRKPPPKIMENAMKGDARKRVTEVVRLSLSRP